MARARTRDWPHVDDHAAGIVRALEAGEPGGSYLIGGGEERRSINLVNTLCNLLDMQAPRRDGRAYGELVTFVTDRPGHDFRYALATGSTCAALDWLPTVKLVDGLRRTAAWYLDNRDWWTTFGRGDGRRGLLQTSAR